MHHPDYNSAMDEIDDDEETTEEDISDAVEAVTNQSAGQKPSDGATVKVDLTSEDIEYIRTSI